VYFPTIQNNPTTTQQQPNNNPTTTQQQPNNNPTTTQQQPKYGNPINEFYVPVDTAKEEGIR